MAQPTRRSFFAGAVAGIMAPTLLGGSPKAVKAELIWNKSDWKLADFHKLVATPARVKQVYNVIQIDEGGFLGSIKNSLNGFHFGWGIPEEQIKIVAAMHGPANMLNYDDYVWKKYKVGEWLKIIDPSTGKSAERNIFYPAKSLPDDAKAANDPNNLDSLFQETSMQHLQTRGVQFLSCHTATEMQARMLASRLNLSEKPEVIVQDMLTHTVPGVLVVASMASAIALLQCDGHYAYMAD